jgi:ribosomal protein S18 acetylase RimI-like enzyme
VPFLRAVYASTREEELRPLAWPPAQLDAFLRMQFDAQHTHYAQHYPDAAREVLMVDGEPAGRLYVHRGDDEILIVDIALLPAFRGRGIGSALVRELLDESDASGNPVRIHVEHQNPAMTLYLRLGFQPLEENGPYLLMERRPRRAPR